METNTRVSASVGLDRAAMLKYDKEGRTVDVGKLLGERYPRNNNWESLMIDNTFQSDQASYRLTNRHETLTTFRCSARSRELLSLEYDVAAPACVFFMKRL